MEKYIRLNANENPYDDIMERVFSEISKDYNKLNRYPDENSYELRKAYGKYHKICYLAYYQVNFL